MGKPATELTPWGKFKRYRWIIPVSLLALAACLLACVASTDSYGQYSNAVADTLVYFLRIGVVTITGLLVLIYARSFKDLLLNILLAVVPVLIAFYPCGWVVCCFYTNKWSAFFGHSPFGLLFFPFVYAGYALLAAPLLCIAIGAVFRWAVKDEGYKLMHTCARETLFWSTSLFFLATCIVALV